MAEQRKLPGFDPERLLTSHVLLAGPKYFSKTSHDTNIVTPQVEAFYDQLSERVRALPGVTRAGIISRLPMERMDARIHGRGKASTGREPPTDGRFHEVDPEALETLGIPGATRGRGIEAQDVASAPGVAAIEESFADRHFPAQASPGTGRSGVDWLGRPAWDHGRAAAATSCRSRCGRDVPRLLPLRRQP